MTAHAWTLSPNDVDKLTKLVGMKAVEQTACTFSCGGEFSVGPAPGNFLIFGRAQTRYFAWTSRIDYLMPEEPAHYSIHQYGCSNLKCLEQKLLQFPKGSTFSFAHTASEDVQAIGRRSASSEKTWLLIQELSSIRNLPSTSKRPMAELRLSRKRSDLGLANFWICKILC